MTVAYTPAAYRRSACETSSTRGKGPITAPSVGTPRPRTSRSSASSPSRTALPPLRRHRRRQQSLRWPRTSDRQAGGRRPSRRRSRWRRRGGQDDDGGDSGDANEQNDAGAVYVPRLLPQMNWVLVSRRGGSRSCPGAGMFTRGYRQEANHKSVISPRWNCHELICFSFVVCLHSSLVVEGRRFSLSRQLFSRAMLSGLVQLLNRVLRNTG